LGELEEEEETSHTPVSAKCISANQILYRNWASKSSNV
jgi:hypothetical protein